MPQHPQTDYVVERLDGDGYELAIETKWLTDDKAGSDDTLCRIAKDVLRLATLYKQGDCDKAWFIVAGTHESFNKFFWGDYGNHCQTMLPCQRTSWDVGEIEIDAVRQAIRELSDTKWFSNGPSRIDLERSQPFFSLSGEFRELEQMAREVEPGRLERNRAGGDRVETLASGRKKRLRHRGERFDQDFLQLEYVAYGWEIKGGKRTGRTGRTGIF